MAAQIENEFVTSGAEIVRRAVLCQEEGQPVPDGAEPATLLARTLIELTQAAHALGCLLDEWVEDDDDEELDDEDGRERPGAAQVAFRFATVSAWTLHAAVRIHPDIRDDPPTRATSFSGTSALTRASKPSRAIRPT